MEAQECRTGGSVTAALEEVGRGLLKSFLCCTPAGFFLAPLREPICHVSPVRASAPVQGPLEMAEVTAVILKGLLACFWELCHLLVGRRSACICLLRVEHVVTCQKASQQCLHLPAAGRGTER